MMDIAVRFLLGGVIVSLFAFAGDLFKPKTFAGLFGAAPSVALASLILTVATHGHQYGAVEARSMVLGAIAFLIYALAIAHFMMRYSISAMKVTLLFLPLWLTCAWGSWWLLTNR